MRRARLQQALPLVLAALLAAVGILLVASRIVRPGAAAREDPCAERLVVIAPDGRPIDVVARRCERGPGRLPALLVAARDPRAARDWRDRLLGWSESGRTTWLLVLEGEESPGPVVEAVLAELAQEAGVDPGRVALLLDAGIADEAGILAPPDGSAALALFEARAGGADGPRETAADEAGVLRVAGPPGRHAPEVHDWLARRLAVAER